MGKLYGFNFPGNKALGTDIEATSPTLEEVLSNVVFSDKHIKLFLSRIIRPPGGDSHIVVVHKTLICECGAKHTSEPDCHERWCDLHEGME